MRKLFLSICISFLCLVLFAQNQPGKIYFIPTLHSLHQSNTRYNYDSLQNIIKRLKPDIISVEIRAEDIAADSAYQRKNYPYEMRMMRYWFPEADILGFDWLGEDIEGKPIAPNYWKEVSAIKQYERDLDADSVYRKRTEACDTFTIQRLAILKSASLGELLQSNDARLTRSFYECLAQNLKGSVHQRLLDFYDLRNEKILINIQNIIRDHPNKTIVILTGDDHFVVLKDRFYHHSTGVSNTL